MLRFQCVARQCSVMFALLLFGYIVDCYPTYRDRIPNGCRVPNPCDTKRVWCGVGHENLHGGGVRNPFGHAFAANGYVWNPTLCNQDSDQDGRTNGQELGDPDCTWTYDSSRPTCSCDPVDCDCRLPGAGLSHPGVCEPLDHPMCMHQNGWFNCTQDFNCSGISEPGVIPLRLVVPPYAVPVNVTTYMCYFMPLPNDTKYHVIASTPIIQQYDVVHHIAIYGCHDIPSPTPPSTHFICPFMPPCYSSIANYAVGRRYNCFTPEYGFPIGSGNGFKYAYIQVHYTNPMLRSGIVDSSGMTLYITRNLRPNDGGIIYAGPMNLTLPPGQPSIIKSGGCTPQCGHPSQPVNITNLIPHMHMTGRRSNVSIYRDGVLKRSLLVNQPFDFIMQASIPLDPHVEFLPGDELRVFCEYNTTSRQCTTYFGEGGSNDEMCLVSASYYPLQPGWNLCLQYGNYAVCSGYFFVTGCDFDALNETLSLLQTCNFLSLNPCAVPCLIDVVNRLRQIGCLQPDVRYLTELKLQTENNQLAADVVNLVWTCAGLPPVAPPAGCLTTAGPGPSTTSQPTTFTTSARGSSSTTSPQSRKPCGRKTKR